MRVVTSDHLHCHMSFPGKAGADILFLDPERKSTTVGVTVSPVRIASLEQFGDVPAVGKRLLDAERAKVSRLLPRS